MLIAIGILCEAPYFQYFNDVSDCSAQREKWKEVYMWNGDRKSFIPSSASSDNCCKCLCCVPGRL